MGRSVLASAALVAAAGAPVVGVALPAMAPTSVGGLGPLAGGRPVTVAVSMVGVLDAVVAHRRDRRQEATPVAAITKTL
jgi:hypothetical protein